MLFSSLSFIFVFLPAFLVCYYFVNTDVRRWLLFLGSILFYAVGEPFFVVLLIASVMINYALSLILCTRNADTGKLQRIVVFLLILLLNLSFLFVFKYWDFFAKICNGVLGKSVVPDLGLALPLGISFYTFQILSYQIDCFAGRQKRPVGFLDFAAFICMFPHLLVGPVMRFGDVKGDLKLCSGNLSGLEKGARKFTIGLGLKVLLADRLSTLYNSIGVIGVDSMSVPLAWLGAIAFSMQIYFDFWGYSVMAMGLGEMLGFTIPENFRQPYWSRSISEFWRRWHITLGEWFKDYIYIPLGGSRKGLPRTCFNLLIVWALTGLWHGAGWNFLLWGLVFFLLIVLEKAAFGKWLDKTRVLGHIYVLCVIPITWVIFSKTDVGEMVRYIGCMFGVGTAVGATQMNQFVRFASQYIVFLAAGAVFVTPLPAKLYGKYKDRWFALPVLLVIFWFSVYQLYLGKNNPFLYFRF